MIEQDKKKIEKNSKEQNQKLENKEIDTANNKGNFLQ